MEYETRIVLHVGIVILPLLAAVIRLMIILPSSNTPVYPRQSQTSFDDEVPENAKVMMFLGSGGHTGEMIKIAESLELQDVHRTWVISTNDSTSIVKCKQFEDTLESTYKPEFITLARARSVGEGLALSVISTIKSFVDAFTKLYHLDLPDVLLLNGPGTSVPIAYIVFLFKYFGMCNTRIVYVESLARVDNLSVSGLLVMPLANRFIVQWPQLAFKYKRAEYYGILI